MAAAQRDSDGAASPDAVILASWAVDQLRRRWGPIGVIELSDPSVVSDTIRFLGSSDALAPTPPPATIQPPTIPPAAEPRPTSPLDAIHRTVAAATTVAERADEPGGRRRNDGDDSITVATITVATLRPAAGVLVAAVAGPKGVSWREFDVADDTPIDTASRVLRWVIEAADGRPTD